MHLHIVYKTTNIINNKYYVGVHTCTCGDNCVYYGSGTALKKAIEKYGLENFTRETLATFKSKKDAYLFERSKVNHLDPQSYNLCEGGEGGAKNKQPCVWDGVHYESQAQAARTLGVSSSTFNSWYKHKVKPKEVKNFMFNGVNYNSYASAARVIGVDPSTMAKWVKKGLSETPKAFEITLFGKTYRKKIDIAQDLGVSPATVTNLIKNPKQYKGQLMVKGVKFATQKEAAKHFGVWPQTISKWVNNPNRKDCFTVKL